MAKCYIGCCDEPGPACGRCSCCTIGLGEEVVEKMRKRYDYWVDRGAEVAKSIVVGTHIDDGYSVREVYAVEPINGTNLTNIHYRYLSGDHYSNIGVMTAEFVGRRVADTELGIALRPWKVTLPGEGPSDPTALQLIPISPCL